MKKMLILEEERGKMWEKTKVEENLSGFKLRFLSKDESQIIHKVEVRKMSFQDLMRHLQHGESVLITPEFRENSLTNAKKQDRTPWYFTHT